jgi:hypothetical protein
MEGQPSDTTSLVRRGRCASATTTEASAAGAGASTSCTAAAAEDVEDDVEDGYDDL